ncbi:hypothetical protein NIE88_14135 [Sporolactobacillus shoreicorticis]|uniref:Uncharacterized protein n=1 Tax=Sporolactobacillus shoreicorticis TaxID=1923877 RepID=A0ABW5SAJ8_9BACL|nr:hypothetical protein [Sporolactobacillus shoreicorticis]MCO7126906.1 hypothetical protein [Sporolactobacillus shoreicorticis]
MDKKEAKPNAEKAKRSKIVTIIAVVCAIDVIATLIYYYASGAFKF